MKRLAVLLFTFFLCCVTVICGWGNSSVYASADESVQETFEQTNVLSDLNGSTIAGKEFDISDYPHDSSGKFQIISFVEFCYSYYADKQSDYGLYVYVYNPQDIAIDMASQRNKIELSYGGTANYSKYELEFLNYSTEAGYEGRFYKFKVKLTDSQRTEILKGVDESKRVYKISGIELSVKGTVTDYECATTYTYSGYALGYGSELATSDTLTCQMDGLEKSLSLDVQSTYYRPEGTNGTANTQDTLHSVYFSVANDIVSQYDCMSAVHATWLNAYTNPIFVTGNKTIYETLSSYIGQYIGTAVGDSMRYAFVANFSSDSITDAYLSTHTFRGDYFYNWNNFGQSSGIHDSDLTQLDYIFYAGSGDNAADSYVLSNEILLEWMKEYTSQYGGDLVNEKYSKALFKSVDEDFTDINIKADEKYSLTSQKTSKSWWSKFFKISDTVEYSTTFDNIEAIHAVTASDVTGTKEEVCQRLYISTADYDDFMAYYNRVTTKSSPETVYLFRYYQSEYYCAEATEFEMPKGNVFSQAYGKASKLDTNAYLAQEWIQLDFDIIDVTFTANGVDMVIPVVMSPKDIAADITNPVVTTNDNGLNWWQILLGVLALILLVIILFPVLPYIVQAIIWIVLLPFKGIAAIGRGIKNGVKRRRENKRNKQVESESSVADNYSYLDEYDWDSDVWEDMDGDGW